MKITIDFEPEGKESAIPYGAKLKIIARIIKAAQNPVEYNTFRVEPFTTTDKQ